MKFRAGYQVKAAWARLTGGPPPVDWLAVWLLVTYSVCLAGCVGISVYSAGWHAGFTDRDNSDARAQDDWRKDICTWVVRRADDAARGHR